MNSKISKYFSGISDTLDPLYKWTAKSILEHRIWRGKFSRKLNFLVGKRPDQVPLDIIWKEPIGLGTVTRQKIYVRSEKDYWVPAYYFFPKVVTSKTPALVCLHGHSGILPYIREGNK